MVFDLFSRLGTVTLLHLAVGGNSSARERICVCDASDSTNAYWTGIPVTCKSVFRSPKALALQPKATFVDRTLSCAEDSVQITMQSSIRAYNVTGSLHNPVECRGRTIVLGEGYIDLIYIYIVDCSQSVGLENFTEILKFVALSALLFNINSGAARVALITYDHNVYQHFNLGEKNSTNDTLAAISKSTFC